MKSLTRGHLKAGIDSVRSAKLRSFWTMLGIIIGVASVITVVSIGEGVKRQVTGQIHHMGKDLITVRPAQLKTGNGAGSESANVLAGLNVSTNLTPKDYSTVSRAKDVASSAPLSILTGKITGVTGEYKNGYIIGTTPDLSSLINQSMAYGAFLTEDDMGIQAAVLGQDASAALFDENVPLGRSFTIRGQEFLVRGIFNDFASTPLSQQADFNKAIFIPYDVAQQLTNGTAPIYQIYAKAHDSDKTSQVTKNIKHALDRSHGGESSTTVIEGSQNIAESNEILDLLTRLIAGVAAISLLVGGIGIMNVMLVSVAERLHEIGIRKAVGATNRQILSQFMIESSILSLAGGVIGIGLAYLVALILRITTSLQPVITWQVVAIASGVSLFVGIVFGSIPALKAARKDPIEALRSD